MVNLSGSAIKIIISATDRASAVLDGVKGKVSGLGGVMDKLRGPMLAVGVAAVAMAAVSIKAFSDFEKKMADVTTLMDRGADANETYGDTVHRLGTEFAVAGGKAGVAAGLYQVVSAGFGDAADAALILEEAVKASIGGSVEAETAITGLTQVLNVYGLEASDVTDVSDIMFQTVAKGVTTYGELNSALSTVLPTAAAAGVDFETVSAAIAAMTKSGLSANEATVSLNRIFLALLKPSEDLSVALSSIAAEQGIISEKAQAATDHFLNQRGILQNLNGELLNQEGVLQELNNELSTQGGAVQELNVDLVEQQSELQQLTAAYDETTAAVSEMSAELDGMSDSMAVNRVKIQEIKLTARRAGRELTEGEIAEIDKIKLANEELSLSYNKLRIDQDSLQETQAEQSATVKEQNEVVSLQEEAIKRAVTEQKEAIKIQEKLIAVQKESIKGQTETVEASSEAMQEASEDTAELLLESEGFARVMELIGEKAGDSTTELSKFFNQSRALKGALVLLADDSEKFNEAIDDMAERAGVSGNAFGVMSETSAAKMQEMQNRIGDLAIKVGAALIPALEKIMPVVEKLIDFFGQLDPAIQAVAIVGGILMGAFALLWPVISGVAGAIGGAGGLTAVLALLTGPIGLIGLAVAALALAWTTNFGGIQDKVFAVWDKIKPLFEKLSDLIGRIAGILIETLGPAFDTVLGAIGVLIDTWWNTLIKPPLDFLIWNLELVIDTLDAVLSAFEGDFKPLANIVKRVVDDINGLFSGLVGGMLDFGKNIVQGLIDGIVSMGSDLVSAFWGIVPEPLRSLMQGGINELQNWGDAAGRGWDDFSRGAADFLGFDDFIARPGMGVAAFSPEDTIIGVKDVQQLTGSSNGPSEIKIYMQNVTFANDYDVDQFKRRFAEQDEDSWARRQNK